MTKRFGNALKKLRQQAGINLLEMSRRTGIARSHLYRLEDGEISEPHVDTLNTLAAVLDIDPEDLYELAWKTTGTGPGMPSLDTYFRTKYKLKDDQIAAVQAAVEHITNTKDTT